MISLFFTVIMHIFFFQSIIKESLNNSNHNNGERQDRLLAKASCRMLKLMARSLMQ